MLKTVSRLLTQNWSEHFIRWDFFQICSGNNNASLLLYTCEVIHLINKGVISRYVQEKGGILLKFNILRLQYVTHNYTWIECQLFWSSPEVSQARFAQYGKIILKPLKNCFLWFNQVAVFTVISWNHYAEIFMNFGTKRL